MDARAAAAAGALASVPMSAVLAAARAAGMPGPLPPVLLARRAAPGLRPAAQVVAGAGVHLAIGALFGLVHGALLGGRREATVPLGLVVWAAGYLVLMPAAGVLPPAPRDDPARQVPLVLAHAVLGAALRLRAPRR